MIKIEKCLQKHLIKVKKYALLHNIIDCWKHCISERLTYKYKLYGRISSLDVEAVKKMVRKDTLNSSSLIKHALSVLFEFSGRGKYYEYSFYNQPRDGFFLTHNPGWGTHMLYEDVLPSTDLATWCPKSQTQHAMNSSFTWKHRIEHKERRTLRLLRFLLKQGCNPNNEIFIKNLIFKHNYHSKTFFIKILEMCYTYGLDENILLNILKENNIRFYNNNVLYYIMPVLDIHKNKLFVDDTVNLCIGWSTKKNFLYTLVNNGKGDLYTLNDDVIGVIISFIYFV